VVANSEAWREGLKANDRILKINGADMKHVTQQCWEGQLKMNKLQLQLQRTTTNFIDSSDSVVYTADFLR